MGYDQFDQLFKEMRDDQRIEYKIIHNSTGEIISRVGTKKEIENLRQQGCQVFVDKDIHNILANNAGGNSLSNALGGLAQKVAKAGIDHVRQNVGRNNVYEEEREGHEEVDRSHELKTQITDQAKNALVTVGKGSAEIIKSTASNAWQAAIHALFAGAGFCVIAGTTYVVQKTVKMLPGAASSVGKLINQLVASTSETVKQITDSVAEAAEKAAAGTKEVVEETEAKPEEEKESE